MNNHPGCYGDMFPDFTRLEKNRPLASPAFNIMIESQGIGLQRKKVEIRNEGWGKCIACPEYRTCYDLSLAKLLMKTILANNLMGA